jgi:hypothetical protein
MHDSATAAPVDAVPSAYTAPAPWASAVRLGMVVAVSWLAIHVCFGAHTIRQDQSWLLYAAQQMLDGVPLYGARLTETNPPLIIWLSAFPAGVARVLGANAPTVFYPMVAAAIAASVLWCFRLLGGTAKVLARGQRLLFAMCVLVAEVFLHLGDFGQREHLLFIMVMPYLVAFGIPRRRALGTFQVVALSVVAAAGICIKPQQVILLLGFQAAVMMLGRTWRWPRHEANVAFGLTLATYAAYGIAVLVFAPLYLTNEMPLLLKTYWAFGRYGVLQLVLLDKVFLALVALGAMLYVLLRLRGASRFGLLLLVSGAASSIAFDLQHTGFNYQWIPQNSLALLAVLWMLADAAGERFPTVVAALAVRRRDAIVFAVSGLLFAGLAARHARSVIPDAGTLEGFYAALPPGTPVMALSTNPQALFPYVEQDRLVLATRFVHLWMLPAVEQNEYAPGARKVLSADVREDLAALQRAQVTEDITQRKPAYVVVPHCPSPLCEAISEPGFDMLAWFEKDAAFSAAWARYRLLERVDAGVSGTVDVYALEDR